MKWVVVAGQVRDRDAARHLLDALLPTFEPASIVLSTWNNEQHVDLLDEYRSAGAAVVQSEPLPIDSWGNVRRQSVLLAAGLDRLSPQDLVYKVRPDWRVSVETVRAVSDVLDRLPPAGQGALTRRQVVVPWWNPQVPFRVGDEAFAGLASDLRLLSQPDPVLSAGCPHIARFAVVSDLSPRLKMFIDGPVAWMSNAQLALRPELAEELGLRRRSAVRRARPPMYTFFRRLARTAVQQPVLADWLYVMREAFCVYNPDPAGDQFLSRFGAPWTAHGYTSARECPDPLRDKRFTISYDSSSSEMKMLAASSPAAAARLRRLDESGGRALSDPVPRSEAAAYRAACYRVFTSTVLVDGGQSMSKWTHQRNGLRNGARA